MRKLQIGVDMDGVLCDILTPWVEIYNRDYDDCLKPSDVTLWNWHTLTRDPNGEKLYTYLDDQDFFRNLPVMPGAKEVLEKYHKDIDFWVCTAAFNIQNAYPKQQWLLEHFPFLDREKFMFVRDKSGLNADVLIDDKNKNLKMFTAANPNADGILFDAPHNREYKDFLRVRNWNDVDIYLEDLLANFNTMKG